MANKTFTQDYKKFPVQYYPLNIKDYYFKKSEKIPLINKKTKIVSMGSCFALHIGRYLKKEVIETMMKFFERRYVK